MTTLMGAIAAGAPLLQGPGNLQEARPGPIGKDCAACHGAEGEGNPAIFAPMVRTIGMNRPGNLLTHGCLAPPTPSCPASHAPDDILARQRTASE